ncbi:MAG: hypothetical protein ABW195_02840, partial [Ilumatobacteraceae bacterium]
MEREGFGLGNWLKAAGGLAFFVAGLLPWWRLEVSDGPLVKTNAFTYDLTGLVPYVIFVGIAIVTIIIETESLRLPRILVNPTLTLLAAFGGSVLVGIRFFMDGYDNTSLESDGYSITRGVGLYVAAVAALVVLAGSVLLFRDRHLVDADADDDDDDDDGPGRDGEAPLGPDAPGQRGNAERARGR